MSACIIIIVNNHLADAFFLYGILRINAMLVDKSIYYIGFFLERTVSRLQFLFYTHPKA